MKILLQWNSVSYPPPSGANHACVQGRFPLHHTHANTAPSFHRCMSGLGTNNAGMFDPRATTAITARRAGRVAQLPTVAFLLTKAVYEMPVLTWRWRNQGSALRDAKHSFLATSPVHNHRAHFYERGAVVRSFIATRIRCATVSKGGCVRLLASDTIALRFDGPSILPNVRT
jgi:hypothetical protein